MNNVRGKTALQNKWGIIFLSIKLNRMKRYEKEQMHHPKLNFPSVQFQSNSIGIL